MKKITKNKPLKYVFIILGLGLLILGFFMYNQGQVVIDSFTPYSYTCDNKIGCTQNDLKTCNDKMIVLGKQQGYTCDNCYVSCANSNQVRGYEYSWTNGVKCGKYDNYGALVEVVGKCTINKQDPTITNTATKTICTDGKSTTFTASSGYPDTIQWEKWSVWKANDLDQPLNGGKVKDCDYACKQIDSMTAKCVTKGSSDDYIAKHHVGCYVVSGRFESWWFDSDNKISERIDRCGVGQGCTVTSKTQAQCYNLDEDVTATYSASDCTNSVVCDSDLTYKCADNSVITTFKCENGCTNPTGEACNVKSGQEEVSVATGCKTYETIDTDSNCVTDYSIAFKTKQFYEDNIIVLSMIIAVIFLIIGFFIFR